jgi:hypothetical protein
MPDAAMPPYALLGRLVTMNQTEDVIAKGAIYIDNGRIAHVDDATATPPQGFENCLTVDTGGTIYPGLVELHNHLSYNILPLWNVPQKYTDRSQWKSSLEKTVAISGPMQLLVNAGGYLGAIVRYVEAKCLLAGVTTSQGLTLINAGGIEKKYRGIIRNAEEPDDTALPKAAHSIEDVAGAGAWERLEKQLNDPNRGCYLLHLCEGDSEHTRQHFQALYDQAHDTWAITDKLAGIHSIGLNSNNLAIFHQHGGSIVWSPLSNLLLYGSTADVKRAKQLQIPIALGSDWSPSGSKNLLGELKVAYLYSKMNGTVFSDVELVRMVTTTPARILRWQNALGSIEAKKFPDLLVMNGQADEPYHQLIANSEADVSLVIIGGTPRYGTTALMKQLGQKGETWRINQSSRMLNLVGAPDGDVSALTLKKAQTILRKALQALPNPPALAVAPIGSIGDDAQSPDQWSLVLDNDGAEALASRALAQMTTAEVIQEMWAASVNLQQVVKPLELDAMTVAEDREQYLTALKTQMNLPPAIASGLGGLYPP